MKTLEHETLLYDKDCPLCQVYTKGFVKTGMLDQNGRQPYSEISSGDQTYVDMKRATDEIALINRKNKTVTYGIDSLLKVIGHSFPWIEKVGHFAPVHFFLRKLYAFISYNRKVIIPSKVSKLTAIQCIPNFNYRYRLLFIGLIGVIVSLILNGFYQSISYVKSSIFLFELCFVLGQLPFQTLFILKADPETKVNYYGNVMTISLFGSLLVLPVSLLNIFFPLGDIVLTSYFGIVVSIMFFEHERRVELLAYPKYLSYTWILYRLLLLPIILNL
ncbi:MAG: hypothetical protein AAF901_00835 [Bacteroidota bacterium]